MAYRLSFLVTLGELSARLLGEGAIRQLAHNLGSNRYLGINRLVISGSTEGAQKG